MIVAWCKIVFSRKVVLTCTHYELANQSPVVEESTVTTHGYNVLRHETHSVNNIFETFLKSRLSSQSFYKSREFLNAHVDIPF